MVRTKGTPQRRKPKPRYRLSGIDRNILFCLLTNKDPMTMWDEDSIPNPHGTPRHVLGNKSKVLGISYGILEKQGLLEKNLGGSYSLTDLGRRRARALFPALDKKARVMFGQRGV